MEVNLRIPRVAVGVQGIALQFRLRSFEETQVGLLAPLFRAATRLAS